MRLNIKFKNDSYKRNRGGHSRLLNILCTSCKKHLFYYQKDGPGPLQRLYLDRIYKSEKYAMLEKNLLKDIPQLMCQNCGDLLGVPYVYPKEKRLAFRLFVAAISKKIVKSGTQYNRRHSGSDYD